MWPQITQKNQEAAGTHHVTVGKRWQESTKKDAEKDVKECLKRRGFREKSCDGRSNGERVNAEFSDSVRRLTPLIHY